MKCSETENAAVAQKSDAASGAGRPPARGSLFVISAPSGAGKTTLVGAMRSRFPGLRYSISHTTRPPRPGERHGVDYFFISADEFRAGIDSGQWAEWAEVHGHYYGTSARFLEQTLAAGQDVLLDIDVQGACQIADKFPGAVTIFILPPSLAVLRRRIESRGTDSPEVIALRMKNARREMQQQDCYDYRIVNDRLEDAIAALAAVIEKHRRGSA